MQVTTATNESSEVQFGARDGADLGGQYFAAQRPIGAVLIAPATGVLARFYHPFASWLAAERGLSCLVFDYRGIGRSLRGKLSECSARKQDWGELDMPAAFDQLTTRVPGVPISLVGHSAGGQLVGLMDNVSRLHRIVQVAGSSGYLGKVAPRLRWQASMLMKVYARLSNRMLGYTATRAIGWGENLPRHVGRQWVEWCSSPGYVENAFGTEIAHHYYADIRAPVLNLSFTDDPIATEATIDDLLRLFAHTRVERRRVNPQEFGLGPIGHVGFFRKNNRVLWPLVADFLTA